MEENIRFVRLFSPMLGNIYIFCFMKRVMLCRNGDHDKEMMVDIAVIFLEIILNNEVHVEEDYEQEIILTFLTDSDIATWMAEVTGIIVYGEVITGKLYVSTLDQKIQIYQKCVPIDLTNNAITDNTENCLKWALFNANLLYSLCLRSTNKDEEESSTAKPLIHNVNLPGITNILISVVYSIMVGQIYADHYKSVSTIIRNTNMYLIFIIEEVMFYYSIVRRPSIIVMYIKF